MSKSQADSKSASPTLGQFNIPWCTAVVSILHVYTYYILFLPYKMRTIFIRLTTYTCGKPTTLLKFDLRYLSSSSSSQDFIPHFHKDY